MKPTNLFSLAECLVDEGVTPIMDNGHLLVRSPYGFITSRLEIQGHQEPRIVVCGRWFKYPNKAAAFIKTILA